MMGVATPRNRLVGKGERAATGSTSAPLRDTGRTAAEGPQTRSGMCHRVKGSGRAGRKSRIPVGWRPGADPPSTAPSGWGPMASAVSITGRPARMRSPVIGPVLLLCRLPGVVSRSCERHPRSRDPAQEATSPGLGARRLRYTSRLVDDVAALCGGSGGCWAPHLLFAWRP